MTDPILPLREFALTVYGGRGPSIPTFHEIRSLGARLYRRQGYSTDYVQALMTHTDPKTTTVYLENPGQLEDRHYRTVGAGLEIER